MENKREIIDQYTKNLIVEDGMSIITCFYQLWNTNEFPKVSFSFLPYMALYCQEAEKIIKTGLIDINGCDCAKNLREILKIFSSKNSETVKIIKKICECESKRFKELEEENSANLGIYITSNKKIVSNTHLRYLRNEQLLHENYDQIERFSKDEAEVIGSYFQIILKELGINVNFDLSTMRTANLIRIGAINIDLYDSKDFFVYHNDPDNLLINLELLYLLSFLGFSNNIVSKLLPYNSLWPVRVRYITVHLVVEALIKLKDKLNMKPILDKAYSNALSTILDNQIVDFEENKLILSKFRNCMMHYSFYNKDQLSIEEKYIDCEKPFCGLVESCFQKSFAEYNAELIEFSLKLESLLLQFFNIDENAIEWDLGGGTE